MILFNDRITIPGIVIADSLAYVGDVIVCNSRTTMSCQVMLSLKSAEPNYAPYNTLPLFTDIPYDYTTCVSPSSQCYEYLMTLPEFEGGTIYPEPS